MNKWNEQIPDELPQKQKKYVGALHGIEHVSVHCRRVLATLTDFEHEFHVFVDSSKGAVVAAVYLRSFNKCKCSVNLIAAKTAIFHVERWRAGLFSDKRDC